MTPQIRTRRRNRRPDPENVDEFTSLGKKSPSDANAQALFAASDRDSDGKLNSREVRASGLLSPDNVQALLGMDDLGAWTVSQADGDGDGGLSYEEYTETRGAGPTEATFVAPNGEKIALQGFRLDVAPAVFKSMDGDSDGRLSANELNAHLTPQEGHAAYNPSAGAERMPEHLVSRNDADGDGALSADELRRAMEAPAYDGKDDATRIDTLIATADSNKDGKLSSDEFGAFAAQPGRISFFDQDEASGVSRVVLARLLQSTFAQLRNDFVAPQARTDVTA